MKHMSNSPQNNHTEALNSSLAIKSKKKSTNMTHPQATKGTSSGKENADESAVTTKPEIDKATDSLLVSLSSCFQRLSIINIPWYATLKSVKYQIKK